MADERTGSPESISDSSIDDDSVVLVNRPQNKRSTVIIDDESISDTTDDTSDSDEPADAVNPTKTDDGVENSSAVSSSSDAFAQYLASKPHAAGSATDSLSANGLESPRIGPFSSVDRLLSSNSTSTGPFGPMSNRQSSSSHSDQPSRSPFSSPHRFSSSLRSAFTDDAVIMPQSHSTVSTALFPATSTSTSTVAPTQTSTSSSSAASHTLQKPPLAPVLSKPTAPGTDTAIPAIAQLKAVTVKVEPVSVTIKPAVAPVKTAIATSASRPVTVTSSGPSTLAPQMVSIRARSGSADLTLEKQQFDRPSGVTSYSSAGQGVAVRTVIRASSNANFEEKESAEKWRDRLWPSRALTSFTRSITRCTPPTLQAGKKIFSNSGLDSNGEKKLQLKPHWQKSDLKKVVSRYDSLAAHNAAFFLLLVEESRESSIQDPAEFEITVSHNNSVCMNLFS